MIDSDDGDVFWFGSFFAKGAVAFVLIAAAIVFWLWGLSNQHQCESRQCPKVTQSAKLIDGNCLCVEVAR